MTLRHQGKTKKSPYRQQDEDSTDAYYSVSETIRRYPRFKPCPDCKYLLIRYIDHCVEEVTYSHLDRLYSLYSDTLIYSAPRAVIEIACTHEDEEYELSATEWQILQEHELSVPKKSAIHLPDDDVCLLRTEVAAALQRLNVFEFAHWYDVVVQSPVIERMLFAYHCSEDYLFDREIQKLIKSTIAEVTGDGSVYGCAHIKPVYVRAHPSDSLARLANPRAKALVWANLPQSAADRTITAGQMLTARYYNVRLDDLDDGVGQQAWLLRVAAAGTSERESDPK